jgi:hypothetical protein
MDLNTPAGDFETRLNRAVPMPDLNAHRFAGVHRTDDGRWHGRCTCGHEEVPADTKDTAWAEIASHYDAELRRVALREKIRRNPRLLHEFEAAQDTIRAFLDTVGEPQ